MLMRLHITSSKYVDVFTHHLVKISNLKSSAGKSLETGVYRCEGWVGHTWWDKSVYWVEKSEVVDSTDLHSESRQRAVMYSLHGNVKVATGVVYLCASKLSEIKYTQWHVKYCKLYLCLSGRVRNHDVLWLWRSEDSWGGGEKPCSAVCRFNAC